MDLTEIDINQNATSLMGEAQRFLSKSDSFLTWKKSCKDCTHLVQILVIGNAIVNSGHKIQCDMGILKKPSVATL